MTWRPVQTWGETGAVEIKIKSDNNGILPGEKNFVASLLLNNDIF